MFRFFLLFIDLDVLDIAAAKDDILELLRRGRNELCDLSVFSAKREHIFKGNRRLFRIDLVQGSDISRKSVSAVPPLVTVPQHT